MRGLVVWEVESKCSASKQERSEARDCQWGKQAADKPVPKHLVVSFVFGSLKACFWFFGK